MNATDVLLGQSRGLRIAVGVVTAVAGTLILAWPGGTLLAVAVLLGIQLIVAGIVRAVTAFTFDADSVAGRILFLLLGVLLVIVGILCLREPLQTIAILVLLFGLSTFVSGALELFHGVTGGGGWAIASGIISILVGVIVLSYPVSSVSTMIWLFGLSLLVVGLTGVFSAFTPSRTRVGSHTRVPPAAPATP
ncbi:HdeD family acid-resistance protein [Actinophytocola sp.]|uniref:HdeD family acid-resistance protein n=1 Tax=Actinophytocola sp. TaxID=1872138 RepID=UPI002ED12E8D